ncbi:MAG: hypothetical protein EXS29_00975 [Pedosphaera sp.]|nr:hypothetical protein [Pedosphaera sp.]MSS99873.1 hypothetical protein [Pedosphaera sp.]
MKQIPAFLAAAFLLAFSACAGPGEKTRTAHSQPCWILATPQVDLALTQLGGHMAPVTFFRDSAQPVQPYHISPWQGEKLDYPVPVLVPLRGDFFCVPFGGNSEAVNGEKHPPHGETAGSLWKHVATKKTGDVTTLTVALETKVRAGKVTKELSLVDGQNVIYSRHVIEGFAGKTPLGHHATLAMPEKDGAFRIATSPFKFGMVAPGLFSDPKQAEYQALHIGARFTDLHKVPVAWKGQPDADLASLPARKGHADLFMLFNEPVGPAWVTATRGDEGWVWFALKDPAVLNGTLFWLENHGRHGLPWFGRNNCVGIEDITGHWADGLAASIAPNVLTKEGIPTAIELSATRPTAVNYIQGVVRVPAGFVEVKTIEFAPGQVTFLSTTGQRVTAPVRHEFLKAGKL